MGAEQMKQELAKQGEVKNFPTMLKLYEEEVSRALPEHLRSNIGRYTRLALTQFRQNSKLMECDPRSVFAGVILASQLGLELGVMGHGYLVPYKNRRTGNYEAQFIPGWKGYVDLVHRSGRAIVWTGAVFEGDRFEYQLGDNPFVRHVPMGEDNEDRITHAYAIGHVKGIEWPIVEVWPVDKIKRHLQRVNKVGDSHYAYENKEMYARKVVLLQVVKYLPASVEISSLVELDNSFATGRSQNLTIDAAAEGMVFSMGADATEIKSEEPTKTETPVVEKSADQSTQKAVDDDAKKREEERVVAAKKKADEKATADKKALEEKQAREKSKLEEQRKKAEAEEAKKVKAAEIAAEKVTQLDVGDIADNDEDTDLGLPPEEGEETTSNGGNSIANFTKEAERLKLTPDTITKLFGASADELPGSILDAAIDTLKGSSYCVRGILFPLDLTGGDKPTAEQLQTLKDEAKKLKVSPEKTAKLWLKTDLEALNGESVARIVAAMRTYQK